VLCSIGCAENTLINTKEQFEKLSTRVQISEHFILNAEETYKYVKNKIEMKF